MAMQKWLLTHKKTVAMEIAGDSESAEEDAEDDVPSAVTPDNLVDSVNTPFQPDPVPSGPSTNSFSEETDSLNKKKKFKSYRQKFRTQWKSQFGNWCQQKDKNNAYCTACCKDIVGGITHISRHEATNMHKNNIKRAEGTPKITTLVPETNDKSRAKKIKEAELKCVMFLHEHNLPFILMDHLPQLIQSVCSDSQLSKDLNISRTKATLITKQCLAPEALKVLSDKVSTSVGYSLILDETTDIATKKSLAAVLRFVDKGQVSDNFFGLVEMKGSTAQDIFDATMHLLNTNNIPISKMIGMAGDNASVMMGLIKGLQALLKRANPEIFVIGCTCHSFNLCASAASIKLPNSVEDFARGIYNYFKNSSKRLEFLNQCQAFLNEKPHKLLKLSQTRWLSLQMVVNRILEQWNCLTLVFQDAVLVENLHSVRDILSNLGNLVFKAYFQFLTYILDIVNKLNLEFQSEKCKIYLLNSRIKTLFKTILRNFIKKEILDDANIRLETLNPSNPRNFLALDDCYFGAKTQILLSDQTIDKNEARNFRLRCLDYYQELCSQIKMRFSFNDPVLTFCSYFDPKIALSGTVGSIAVKSLECFPKLVTDIEKLDAEWRLLSDCEEIQKLKNLDFENFWSNIFYLKNDIDVAMFPNLSILVQGIMSLPHSSAAAERVFSELNLLKTKTRNRLLVDTCDAILHAKGMLKTDKCYTWTPSERLMTRNPQYRLPASAEKNNK